MSFFYDLNKKLDSIRATPEVTHKQLNERDEGKPGKNFAKIAKDAGERYGSKEAGERVAGAVRNKLKAQGKLEEEGMSRAAKGYEKYGKEGMEALAKAGREGKALDPVRKKYNKYDESVNENAAAGYSPEMQARIKIATPQQLSQMAHELAGDPSHYKNEYRNLEAAQSELKGTTKYEEGMGDMARKVGGMVKKVAGKALDKVGHGSDADMIRDLQRKMGVPQTGMKPGSEPNPKQIKEKMSPAKAKSFAALAEPKDKITFADKIAGAKKEVDEMLGDVAAEAMKSALSGGQKKLDKNNNGKLDANDFAMLRKGGKQKTTEEDDDNNPFTNWKKPRAEKPRVGSVERGHKHDIEHTATGRKVTRRTDDQGYSVGADDAADAEPQKRGRGRPAGTGSKMGAKGPSGRSKLMTREGEVDVTDQGEYDQEGDMAKDDIKTIVRHAQALSKVLGDNDNLPEWVQSKLAKIEGMMISIDEYMQNQEGDNSEEEPIAEKAVSKQQQKFMGMAHAMQKGEKVKGASPELKKVAKTMKPKDTEDFAKTKHKGLPDKVKRKKKEEDVEESTTSAGAVATSTATTSSKGGVYGKGIYDSMNRELENMIAESMSINMSDSTEGNKSLTVTATDDDAMKLAVMLKSAGLGGQGRELQSDESCSTCGMPDCGCGDVQEAVDENSPDWPTNTETSPDALQYAGGLNKPKTDVAGDGQTTIPNTAVHTQDEDALRRMMEMAGLAEAAKPDFLDMDKDGDKEESMKDAVKDKEEDTVEESIRRMREMAGIQEAKKEVDEEKTEEGNLFTGNLAKARADGKKEADLDGDGDMEKVRESIFSLTNQWKTYKG
jgi:hypothetical protein